MGGDHHHAPKIPPVPDYRMYQVDGVPELERIRNMLAKDGLKDPWLRNEVWRYPKAHEKQWTRYSFFKPIYLSGFKYGFAAFVLTVIGEKTYHHFYPKEDHGHHH